MTVCRPLIGILISATLLSSLSGCSSHTLVAKIDAPSRSISTREARQLMAKAVQELYQEYGKPPIPVALVKSNRERVVLGITMDGKANDYFTEYRAIQSLAVEKFVRAHTQNYSYDVMSGERVLRMDCLTDKSQWALAHFEKEQAARNFIDGLLTLKNAASVCDTEEADFASFSAAVKGWLAAETKPPMSDEARTCKARAEDAFKRKQFDTALDAYVEGLGKYPMWPEGHYNAALLAGENEDYELAARHMRRYLALAPDAKDASAAKDKYLLWRSKAKE